MLFAYLMKNEDRIHQIRRGIRVLTIVVGPSNTSMLVNVSPSAKTTRTLPWPYQPDSRGEVVSRLA